MTPVKVLVVDDSAVTRQILSAGLAEDPELEVVGTAGDVYRARELILTRHPQVLTLDVEMPGMDGMAFLKKLMPQYPLPVVMVSSLTGPGASVALEALEWGAVEVVGKPSAKLREGLEAMMGDLRQKVKAASLADVSGWRPPPRSRVPSSIPPETLREPDRTLVAIGASTGGTAALRSLLTALPANMAPTIVVQHMPAGFTRLFAEKLDRDCQVSVKEAEDGDRLSQGKVLVAPGGLQTTVVKAGGQYLVKVRSGNKVNGHAPSVDVLFESVAQAAAGSSIGLILTGMGRDGAAGLLAMRRSGARTLSQDEQSSLIYGMPMEAWKLGGSEKQVSLAQAPQEILALLRRMNP